MQIQREVGNANFTKICLMLQFAKNVMYDSMNGLPSTHSTRKTQIYLQISANLQLDVHLFTQREAEMLKLRVQTSSVTIRHQVSYKKFKTQLLSDETFIGKQ